MTARHMRGMGLAVPQVVRDGWSGPELRAFVTRAEQLGYDSLWVCELLSAPILDPVGLLNYLAALTTRPRLGVAVLVTPLRVPYQLAADLATVDRLSDGRLIAGVGLGDHRESYARYGLSSERRLRRYLDGLELIGRLWTRDRVTFDSQWWRLDDAPAGVRPLQRPRPPLWIGARDERAVRRAAEIGDGWVGSGSSSAEEALRSLDVVRARLAELGRDPETFALAKRVYLHVTDDQRRDTGRLRRWFGDNYGRPGLADTVPVVGEAEHCAGQLRRLREAGIRTVILHPVLDEAEQMERLAAEVIPSVGFQ
ncbi:MAG: LLM class flavin-dependent oxidoreductase [Nocardioidaceae bacterium]